MALNAQVKVLNPVLSVVQWDSATEPLVAVQETGYVDSNFILTHLIRQILAEGNKLVLVGTHYDPAHYQAIGQRIGYNLTQEMARKNAAHIDFLNDMSKMFDDVLSERTNILRNLLRSIRDKITEMGGAWCAEGVACTDKDSGPAFFVIIDDLSHFLDLGIALADLLDFQSALANLGGGARHLVGVIANCHVGDERTRILATNWRYMADLCVDVNPLKTGRSNDVHGTMAVVRPRLRQRALLQYKMYDRGVKTFHPGESLRQILT